MSWRTCIYSVLRASDACLPEIDPGEQLLSETGAEARLGAHKALDLFFPDEKGKIQHPSLQCTF